MTTATPRSIEQDSGPSPAAAATPARGRRRAPGPRDPYGLLNALRLSFGTLPFLRELADRYGDVAHLKMLGRDYFLVSHPADIESALVKHAAVMGRDEYIETLERTLGKGLLTSDGELWKRQRKLMAQAFTPKRIRDYGEAMVRVSDGALSCRDGEEINVHSEMSRVTMEVVAGVLFGAAIGRREVGVVARAMDALNAFYANSPEAMLKLPGWVPTPMNRKANAAVEALDGLIYGIIGKRRRSGEQRDDLLGTLLSALDDAGSGMTDRQLRDEAMTLFLAGHETTALALAHTLYLLGTHPEVERRLLAELDEVLGGRLPTAEDAKRLVYTERVLKESMRIYPPVWTTGREALEDVELGGFRIPKGAQILVSQWVVHHDARFFPDPEAFDPDRWEPERSKTLPRYAYFPFGGGPRVCIGNHFALLEATLILAVALSRYHFELLPGQTLDFTPSVTLRPKGPGLRMRVHLRGPRSRSEQPETP